MKIAGGGRGSRVNTMREWFDRYKALDKSFSWSFTGFIVGVCAVALAVYLGFFHEKSSQFKMEVISNLPVLDVKEEVSNLKILYNDRDIRQSHESLSVVNIKVRNSGNKSISILDYDQKHPVGLSVVNGKVLEKPSIVRPTTGYLSMLDVKLSEEKDITFEPFILNPSEEFQLKLLVLHPQREDLKIDSLGAIAGSSVKIQDARLITSLSWQDMIVPLMLF
ncbi:MAG: hypothetical protein NTU83_08560, partial [Candidatus Hydrogenedentes bacterium]|nr:hypothetical protein [Candidatus Hydrogenedentota bacterium]